jgi:HAD superfamily hydrolase (TIGR01509 family)
VIRAVLFDYGNTLVPFGRREAAAVDRAVAALLAPRCPGRSPEDLAAASGRVKERLIAGAMASGREITGPEYAAALAGACGLPGEGPALEAELDRAVGDAFEAALRLPEDTLPVLDRLRGRFRLALVSNYYLPAPLRRTLDRFGIAGRLDATVVSAEVGWVKPRPEPFRAALEALDLEPAACAFVGDNAFADVGGAAALGMATVRTTEFLGDALAVDAHGEERAPAPDAVVARLRDLPAVLEGWGRR